MPLSGQTGRRRLYVLDVSVRPSVRPCSSVTVFTELVNTIILKKDMEPIATNGPRGKGMKCSTLEVIGSKVKVTRTRRPGAGIIRDPQFLVLH